MPENWVCSEARNHHRNRDLLSCLNDSFVEKSGYRQTLGGNLKISLLRCKGLFIYFFTEEHNVIFVNMDIGHVNRMSGTKETKKRGILKSITYRIICIVSLLSVTLALTGNFSQSILITVIFQTIQTILYYLHERFWARYFPIVEKGTG